MKTFKDLVFKDHAINPGKQAVILFENGYGASVVRFKIGGKYASYTTNENEWELAVIRGSKSGWSIVYNTPITDNVIGHLSSVGVSDVLKKIQELPK